MQATSRMASVVSSAVPARRRLIRDVRRRYAPSERKTNEASRDSSQPLTRDLRSELRHPFAIRGLRQPSGDLVSTVCARSRMRGHRPASTTLQQESGYTRRCRSSTRRSLLSTTAIGTPMDVSWKTVTHSIQWYFPASNANDTIRNAEPVAPLNAWEPRRALTLSPPLQPRILRPCPLPQPGIELERASSN